MSVTCVHVVTDVMVPSLERAEYLDELRNIADNVVRERLEHSEVHPLAHTGPLTDASSCEMAQSHSQTPTNIGTSAKDGGLEGVGPCFETHVSDVTEDAQCVQRHVDVRPAFDIPMTQAKSLEELPSQLEFDWQDSTPSIPTPCVGAARNLDGDLDGVVTPRSEPGPTDVGTGTFVEVSQIAREAVLDSAPQPTAEALTPLATTSDVIDADASRI